MSLKGLLLNSQNGYMGRGVGGGAGITSLHSDDNEDDDDEDNDGDFFLWYGWLTKGVKPYFQPRPLSEILTISNLR